MIVDFNYPWGTQYIDLMIDTIIDTSVIEAGDQERWIRHTIPMTLQAYMFESFDSPADIPTAAAGNAFTKRVRTVKEFLVEVWDWQGKTKYSDIVVDQTTSENP
jgi:hypothetical protein